MTHHLLQMTMMMMMIQGLVPLHTVSQTHSELDNGQDVSGTFRPNFEESVSGNNRGGRGEAAIAMALNRRP
jgi:hypothetical protein